MREEEEGEIRRKTNVSEKVCLISLRVLFNVLWLGPVAKLEDAVLLASANTGKHSVYVRKDHS